MTLPASQPSYFDWSEAGAPSLNNVAGSQLEVLRACLKNGFNSRVVTSIDVAGGLATATAASHGYTATPGKLLLIEGAPDALLNGRKQPLSVATNTFTFAAPGVADGSYTGTMSAKRAPLGWTEKFTATNAAIFARSVIEATAMELRVVDTGASPASATSARWFGVETSSGIDTYAGQFPTAAQLPGGQYQWKGNNSATAKRWALIGTGRFFYLFVESASAPLQTLNLAYFGDGRTHMAVGSYDCLIGGNTADSGAQANALNVKTLGDAPTSYGSVIARVSALTGAAVRAAHHMLSVVAGGQIGSSGPASPSPINSSFTFVRPVFYNEENTASLHPVRGEMPGMAYPLNKDAAASFDLVTPSEGDGRTYFFARVGNNVASSTHVMIDLTGPWH